MYADVRNRCLAIDGGLAGLIIPLSSEPWLVYRLYRPSGLGDPANRARAQWNGARNRTRMGGDQVEYEHRLTPEHEHEHEHEKPETAKETVQLKTSLKMLIYY
jgi:hypothetical protein